MSQPLLSILIPTIVGRESQYFYLVNTLCSQYKGTKVEIATLKDNKEMPVGEKRNKLYQMANGLYSFMPDDDDSVANNFIEQILLGIESGSDCITYFEQVNIDEEVSKSNHSILYSGWHDNPLWPEGFKYARTPYFKDVIKTEIAKSIPVPEIRWNEDEQWSNALHPHLKNEFHINEFMYFYKTISSNPTERYGLNRDKKTDTD